MSRVSANFLNVCHDFAEFEEISFSVDWKFLCWVRWGHFSILRLGTKRWNAEEPSMPYNDKSSRVAVGSRSLREFWWVFWSSWEILRSTREDRVAYTTKGVSTRGNVEFPKCANLILSVVKWDVSIATNEEMEIRAVTYPGGWGQIPMAWWTSMAPRRLFLALRPLNTYALLATYQIKS